MYFHGYKLDIVKRKLTYNWIITYLLIFSLYGITGCQKEYHPESATTLIQGKIMHSPGSLNTIELISEEFSNQRTFYKHTTNNAEFSFQLKQYYPGNVKLILNNHSVPIYVHPGDQLMINLDYQSPQNYTILSDKKTRKRNKLMQKFHAGMDTIRTASFDTIIKYRSFDEFNAYLTDESEKLFRYLNQFLKKHDICCGFKEWAKNEIEYYKPYHLLTYRWLKPFANGKDPSLHKPSDFSTSFLQAINTVNPNALKSKSYNRFLHELSHSMILDLNISRGKSGKKITDRTRLQYLQAQMESDFLTSYFLADQYEDILHFAPKDTLEQLTPDILEYVPYGIAREYIQDQYWKKKYFDDAGEAILSDLPYETVREFIESLPENYNNQIVYIDIWANWCGACIKKFPELKKMQQKLDKSPVVFVTFAIESDHSKAKEILLQEKLPGEHFVLTKTQSEELKTIFQFSGIPRYLLINGKGEIISDEAPMPGSRAVEFIKEHI
jgi:thiol-disulfide isomerase/thioredoxin